MTKPLFALIIEDHENLAKTFAKALSTANFETEIAKNGQDALARLASMTPDVVVLDLHLPKVSGKDILKQIRDDTRLAKTRVMVVTADALLAENLRKEADLVLLKPVSFGQLQDMAIQLLTSDKEPHDNE